jgi:hypothetical protein
VNLLPGEIYCLQPNFYFSAVSADKPSLELRAMNVFIIICLMIV